MHAGVRVSVEHARGCGFRKKGGLYLVCSGPGRACGKLPLVLKVCPTCGAGIKPARGWTWVDPEALFRERVCLAQDDCGGCPIATTERLKAMGRAGMIWVGEKFYSTPAAFVKEADAQGISRRIAAVPQGFKAGSTWVLLAHRVAVWEGHEGEPLPNVGQRPRAWLRTPEPVPAVFRMFLPERVEQVVDETVTDEDAAALLKRGITPVIVRRVDENGELFEPEDEERPEPKMVYRCRKCGSEISAATADDNDGLCEECAADDSKG
jgi:hypothetical protein